MSLLSTLYVGRSGLGAATAGIQATSQNVANALTPGFNRRGVGQSVADPVAYGGLLLGQGTRVDGVTRSTDRVLTMRRLAEAGGFASAVQEERGLTLLESSFGEAGMDTLRDLYDGVFVSMDALTADPSSVTLRTQVLESMDQLAGRVRGTAAEIEAAQRGFLSSIDGGLSDVNAALQEVAELNRQIVAGGGDSASADLADQRDVILRELAESVGATADLTADGQATVMIGGHAVVNGLTAREVRLDNVVGEPPRLQVSAGEGWLDISSQAEGSMVGLLNAYAKGEDYLAELNDFATTFATALNDQHALGFDADGLPGGVLFDVDPSNAASSFALSAQVLDQPDKLAVSSSSDPALVGNIDNLVALFAIEDDTSLGGGTSLGGLLTNLSAKVGQDVNAAVRDREQAGAIVADLDALAESLSGVDMDEEAANLLAYQTAYQAAARVVSTADGLLSTLLELV